MAKRTLETVDVQISSDNTDSALQVVADGYSNIYKVITEYAQNSLDSAARLLEELGRLPHPIEIRIDIDTKAGEVRILDNCKGMPIDKLKGLALNAFSPTKNAKGAIVRVGIGIHTFLSYFKRMRVRTKCEGRLLEMSLQRGQENLMGNKIYELIGEDFPYDSGTEIVLSGVEPTKNKTFHADPDKLRAEAERRFGVALVNPHIRITICQDGSDELTCKSPQAYGARHIQLS